MRHPSVIAGAIGVAALLAAGVAPAAAPQSVAAAATARSPASSPPAGRARASIRLDVGRAASWVGQAIPVTVRAQFREVEGVALEGAPELKSDSVFTTDLPREPRQSTEVVDGEPVIVATWTGTITPSTPGPLALSVELPVRLRFHEAVAQPAFRDPRDPGDGDGDPFASMDVDPSDPTSIQRLFQSFQQSFARSFHSSMQGALGRPHDDAVALKASSPAMQVKPLPVAGQPASFSGAVGRFDLRASVASTHVHASEPVTLQITLQGDGDLDRVELPGIGTSSDWKAYPVTSKTEAPAPGNRAGRTGRKLFEQVLIPLHGGSLTIPSIALSAFDPVAGRYTSSETAQLTVSVEGPLAPAATPARGGTLDAPEGPVDAAAHAPLDVPVANALPAPSPASLVASPRSLGLRLSPILALLLAAVGVRSWRRGGGQEKSLRRALRSAARGGRVAAFFDAARRLIAVHFAKRWGVTEGDVTVDALRQHLGPAADPLVSAITSAEAMRFGRRDLQPTELWTVCSSIEASLRNAR